MLDKGNFHNNGRQADLAKRLDMPLAEVRYAVKKRREGSKRGRRERVKSLIDLSIKDSGAALDIKHSTKR